MASTAGVSSAEANCGLRMLFKSGSPTSQAKGSKKSWILDPFIRLGVDKVTNTENLFSAKVLPPQSNRYASDTEGLETLTAFPLKINIPCSF